MRLPTLPPWCAPVFVACVLLSTRRGAKILLPMYARSPLTPKVLLESCFGVGIKGSEQCVEARATAAPCWNDQALPLVNQHSHQAHIKNQLAQESKKINRPKKRKTSKKSKKQSEKLQKTETKIWASSLKKQSGALPPPPELSGPRDLSLCHHGNIHHSVVELDLWHRHTTFWIIGSSRCIATARLPHDRVTDSKEPPSCSVLSGWLAWCCNVAPLSPSLFGALVQLPANCDQQLLLTVECSREPLLTVACSRER